MDKASAALLVLLIVATQAGADAPMSYMQTYGPAADPVTRLNWGLSAISVAVTAIVALLVLIAIFHKRPPISRDEQGRLPVLTTTGGLRWIVIGVSISTAVLLACAIWTAVTLSAVASPATKPPLEIQITAHQWWWEVTYLGTSQSQVITTANEIHIPVGRPVRFKLVSDNVIHSFWIPQLGGKTDVIPGQTNYAWLQADKQGTYRGQCGEYCGAQHAHMALYVVADPPAQFDAWRQAQLKPALESPSEGQDIFLARCAACHTVRGTPAGGTVGPDLTHLMSRGTLASGLLANNIGNLHGWIANPQALKPGALMPRIALDPQELHSVVAYLETLR